MKKIIVPFVFALLFVIFILPVSAEKVTIDKDVLEKILQRQESMEKKIELLEEKSDQDKAKTVSPVQGVEYLKEDVVELSERLDKVETKSILDRITIGGELRVRMDSFDYENYQNPLGLKSDTNVNDKWSNRLRLNLKSEITDNIVFHGRLSYFKLWGDSNFPTAATDMANPSIPDAEGDLHIERAYIDYYLPGTPLSFTFGRVPTSEGPPGELRDNTTRKGTWPSLLVNGEVDGIFVNLATDKWTGLIIPCSELFTQNSFRIIQSIKE